MTWKILRRKTNRTRLWLIILVIIHHCGLARLRCCLRGRSFRAGGRLELAQGGHGVKATKHGDCPSWFLGTHRLRGWWGRLFDGLFLFLCAFIEGNKIIKQPFKQRQMRLDYTGLSWMNSKYWLLFHPIQMLTFISSYPNTDFYFILSKYWRLFHPIEILTFISSYPNTDVYFILSKYWRLFHPIQILTFISSYPKRCAAHKWESISS